MGNRLTEQSRRRVRKIVGFDLLLIAIIAIVVKLYMALVPVQEQNFSGQVYKLSVVPKKGTLLLKLSLKNEGEVLWNVVEDSGLSARIRLNDSEGNRIVERVIELGDPGVLEQGESKTFELPLDGISHRGSAELLMILYDRRRVQFDMKCRTW